MDLSAIGEHGDGLLLIFGYLLGRIELRVSRLEKLFKSLKGEVHVLAKKQAR